MSKKATHGHSSRAYRSPTYHTWEGMKQRCLNPNHKKYTSYGGAGITITLRWLVFANFLEDMGERPQGLTLDRIDPLKGYSKENCRWATPTAQNYNQRLRSDNSSGCKGVTWNTMGQKWQAQAWKNGKAVNLYYGPFKNEAIAARRQWEKENGARHA